MKKTVIQAATLGVLGVALVGAVVLLSGVVPLGGMGEKDARATNANALAASSTQQGNTETGADQGTSNVQSQAKVERTTITTQVTAPGEVKAVSSEKLKLDKNRNYKELVAPLNTRITKGTPLVNYTWGDPLVAPYDLVLTAHELPAKANENPTDEHYLQVSRVDSMNVDIPVNEASVSQVKEGQAAQVKPGAFSGEELSGSVSFINQVGAYQAAGSRYTVTVNVANSDGRLLMGMSAQVAIKTAEASEVLSVPVSAIYRNGEQTTVRLVKEDGQVEERNVTCGVSDGKRVEVSGDINEGDMVQTSEVSTQVQDASGSKIPAGQGATTNSNSSSQPTNPSGA